ncbi:hypothetical protein SAMN05216241_10383 [Limimonas halophila]|uniref:Uncharacterized protein n=2 Tax=Limimonas halophila TaxID=1082479 RepID=A0A1G7PV13_9PROT|nr:hypothetical protein SAMN05216241_10383 [Limimonas halophila]
MNESGRSLLVFLAALPLINSVADWLSLGLTRHLLSRAGGTWSSLGNGVVDALAAVIFLGVLAVAVTAGLQGLNALALASGAEAALIDVAGVLQRVRETPGDPAVWWVYIMLFSTLLPSFAHAVVAAAAVVTVALPGSWRDWQRKKLAAGFTEDHPQEVWRAAAFLTLRRVAAILLALLALGAVAAVLGGYHVALPWLADALLVIAETTAMALGA